MEFGAATGNRLKPVAEYPVAEYPVAEYKCLTTCEIRHLWKSNK
jgi:hypothetical protein